MKHSFTLPAIVVVLFHSRAVVFRCWIVQIGMLDDFGSARILLSFFPAFSLVFSLLLLFHLTLTFGKGVRISGDGGRP